MIPYLQPYRVGPRDVRSFVFNDPETADHPAFYLQPCDDALLFASCEPQNPSNGRDDVQAVAATVDPYDPALSNYNIDNARYRAMDAGFVLINPFRWAPLPSADPYVALFLNDAGAYGGTIVTVVGHVRLHALHGLRR